MQSALEVGDEVMLASGIFGTVRALNERFAHVDIANGVTVKVARGAIGQVVHEDESTTRDAGQTGDGEASEEN
jgi:preprotein translocase subunit YajC